MQARIKKVMGDVFNVDPDEINENTAPDNLEAWDSLKHMNLVVALEEEFNVEFDDDEIEGLLNFQLIVLTLEEKT